MQRRSRLDIIEDMLRCLVDNGGKLKQTRLMYKANLSHPQMKQYLAELLEGALLEESKKGRSTFFEITLKGRSFLEKLAEMKEFEKRFGLA